MTPSRRAGAGGARSRDARRRSADRLAAATLALVVGVAPAASASVYPLPPGATSVGAVETYVIRAGDNLPDIARRFDLGYTELVVANPGVDPWLPAAGTRLVLPLQHLLPDAPYRGIVVDLAERRLFYFPPRSGTAETFPIGVAVHGLDSPLGVTRVTAKETDPVWVPPASIRAEEPGLPSVVPAGPDNPLGQYALRLGWPDYLIHGTNKPDGVGRNVSHGCLHLYPEDIAKLFAEVAVGTTVRVLNEPVLVRWVGGALFLEVHPDKDQTEAVDDGAAMPVHPPADLAARIIAAAGARSDQVDWRAVDRAGRARDGIPVEIIAPTEAH